LSRKFAGVVGFDISARRVASLRQGHDWTGEIPDQEMSALDLTITDDPEALAGATFIIVTVPTPIDSENRPNLGPIESACRLIGRRLSPGALVVFESTVYPGVTEHICGPLLEDVSGLRRGTDFFLGYSPERINPGDKLHRLETITKIVAAENEAALERVKSVYGAVVTAGLHVAPTIKVAEAAKVIENTQRDLNIALMNELSLIFDRMEIRTEDVLEAACTKWNFINFRPGLVGGHCIGVDPYYLTTAAEKLGYRPEVILAGRNINDNMGAYVAQKLIKLLAKAGRPVNGARVGMLGLTFKENVPDLRNSRVPDILRELADFGIDALVHDPLANPEEALHEYGIELASLDQLNELDALIVAVGHDEYINEGEALLARLAGKGVLVDIKSVLALDVVGNKAIYWAL
jgi:UDP-N-acetyl-D-galactosamine dehydrogenase